MTNIRVMYCEPGNLYNGATGTIVDGYQEIENCTWIAFDCDNPPGCTGFSTRAMRSEFLRPLKPLNIAAHVGGIA